MIISRLYLYLIIFTGSFFISSTCSAISQDVYYGGFAYTGKHSNIGSNFKYTSKLNTSDNNKIGLIESRFTDYFKASSASNKNINILFDKARSTNSSSETIVMSVALSREDIFTEELSDCKKAVLNISFNIIFIDMVSKKIINSYPINLEFVDVVQGDINEEYLLKLVRSAYFSEDNKHETVLSILDKEFKRYKVAGANIRSIQVKKVTIDNKALKSLFSKDISTSSEIYSDTIAQKFSDELSRTANVSVLPSGRDALNGKCSLVFANGKEQDFIIPEASYAVDISLEDLQTKNLNANDIEKAIAFGAFLSVRVYEPEFNIEFYKKRVVHGSAKKFANTTKNYDEHGIFKEVVQIAVKKSIVEMTNDNKLSEEVIKRCAVL